VRSTQAGSVFESTFNYFVVSYPVPILFNSKLLVLKGAPGKIYICVQLALLSIELNTFHEIAEMTGASEAVMLSSKLENHNVRSRNRKLTKN